MNCLEFGKLIDSYLSDELLVETNHEILRHLENCHGCRERLGAQRMLRQRLRSAVIDSAESSADHTFLLRTKSELREIALRPGVIYRISSMLSQVSLGPVLAGAAIVLVLSAAVMFIPWRGPETAVKKAGPGSQDEVVNANRAMIVDAVRAGWTTLSDQAIDDHKNCAVKFNLTEDPIPLNIAAEKYGRFNKDLDKPVVKALDTIFPGTGSDTVKFIDAHSCAFNGRRFTHIELSQRGEKISVIITDTDLPSASGSIDQFHSGELMNASGFRVGRHAIFVVSQLKSDDNFLIARAIEPAIRKHIESAGV